MGRTGAGKSSLITALFRFCELKSGQIFIDNTDISQIDLERLRSGLALIPQDPLLFSGTIKENLDLYNSFSEKEIWKTLELVGIDEKIQKLPKKLKTTVSEGGENFSMGERQLLCLARALLLKGKREKEHGSFILVLDEATASIDMQTDRIIQKALRDHCKDATVIIIAHRLDTIIDTDKILVLNNGQIEDFDSPKALLSKEHSLFWSLAKATDDFDNLMMKADQKWQ